MLRFSLFGIPITVQPWFWITLALLGGAINAHNSQALMGVLLFVLAGFLSVLVHELGHALTGKAFGAPTQITLMAFGGYASFPANAFNRTQDFLVTAAGPAIQLVLGGMFFLIGAFVELPTFAARYFVWSVMAISVFWALLNLIPVIPLDGGRLMSALLGPARRRQALVVSLVCAVAGAVVSLLFLKGIIFPILLALMAHQNWQELQHERR